MRDVTIRVNEQAREYAENLIKGRQYERESDWSKAQPSTEQENEFIEEHGWEAYSRWHLAYDDEQNEETKGRYKFPFGDFEKLHRSGLIAAEQRAGSESYGELERSARELLDSLPGEG